MLFEQIGAPKEIPTALTGMKGLNQGASLPPRASLNTCIGASTVLDHFVELASQRIDRILVTMRGSKQWEAQNADKFPAFRITTTTNNDKSLVAFQAPDDPQIRPQITVQTSQIRETVGGGALNALADAAVTKAVMQNLFGLQTIPPDTLTFSAPQRIRARVLELVEAAGVDNLRVQALDGDIRQTFVLQDEKKDRKITLNTLTGTVAEGQTIKLPTESGYWLFNNEVGNQVFSDALKWLRAHPEAKRQPIWAVGSKQLAQDPSKFDSFLTKCNTVILNLDEAVDWILRHSDTEFSQDVALLRLLEAEPLSTTHTKKVQGYAEGILQKVSQIASLLKLDTAPPVNVPTTKYSLPEDPQIRIQAAQRVADLIHSMGLEKGTVFITDGGYPTISSRKYKDSSEQVKKVQLYIPVLTGDEVDKIKDAIQEHTDKAPREYTIGCGDSVAGTILALKQLTNDQVLPSTITIMANYISCLLRWMPYPNLLEIQAKYPELVRTVLALALQKLDEKDEATFGHHRLELIPEAMKGRTPSIFGRELIQFKSSGT